MNAAQQLAAEIGNTRRACEALGVPRATLYRKILPAPRRPSSPARAPRRRPRRALSPIERERVLAHLHSPRFADLAPAQVHATLLDEGTFLCSVRTMHRLLAGAGESRERRCVRRRPPAPIPRVVARAPNEVWTWDITKLPGPTKGTHHALYVVLDLYSRFVVGWTVARRELASLAEDLLRESCEKHGVLPGQLTVHSDRGAPMTSKSVALLFADLGVTASLSRPRVSDDNPFSESHFRTAKDDWTYPGRFDSPGHAREWARDFMNRYNTEHHHSNLALLTPEQVFTGRADEILDARHAVMMAAYCAHPERFVAGAPRRGSLPTEVWINPPARSLEPAAGQ